MISHVPALQQVIDNEDKMSPDDAREYCRKRQLFLDFYDCPIGHQVLWEHTKDSMLFRDPMTGNSWTQYILGRQSYVLDLFKHIPDLLVKVWATFYHNEMQTRINELLNKDGES